jgi:hypothetical protein
MIRAIEIEEAPAPRVLEVDEWAWRKEQIYGTILCDLERGRVVDLLPERSAQSFAAWLRQHPGVEIVVRAGAVSTPTAPAKVPPRRARLLIDGICSVTSAKPCGPPLIVIAGRFGQRRGRSPNT